MPLIEYAMIVGAIAALVHAYRWFRARGDASNLVVWISSVVCVLLLEPFAYAPQWFGLETQPGPLIVHNRFSVQFLHDRLPLYIVAMYPVFVYVAYVIVQHTGAFRRHGPVVGATCVMFVFHCLYAVIDTVAVQFRWWVWSETLSLSKPALGAVPYVNIQAFALGVPFALALATSVVTRRTRPGSAIMVGCAVGVVCLLIWPIELALAAPAVIIDLVGASTETGRFVGTWLLVTIAGAVTASVFARIDRHPDVDVTDAREGRDRFALTCVMVYLLIAAGIWIAALPDYLTARDGHTLDGAPLGSLPYAVITFVLSIALTTRAYRRTTRRSSQVTGRPAVPGASTMQSRDTAAG
ncbi:hypothetical protein AB0M45_30610 [Nocardia sp. NPDC051787]|uniref:hypothetical protein n=1 Tax=Nocardia sp. NPDC051787 TaxID=3155415 RepID=UPI0034200453